MQEADDTSSLGEENPTSEVMEGVGEPSSAKEEAEEGQNREDLPQYAKERLGREKKRHTRELRRMQDQISALQSQLSSPNQYQQPQQQESFPQGEDDRIQLAISRALQLQKDEEKRMKEAEKAHHVQKQYRALEDHLDKASEKYDDFEDVVRGHDAPYTEAMRDTALLLPNAADVLYKLGKNRSELERIKDLHPLEQAKEMIKLSHALINGGEKATSSPKTLGQVKSSPVSSSQGINEHTSIGELRRKMRAGFK